MKINVHEIMICFFWIFGLIWGINGAATKDEGSLIAAGLMVFGTTIVGVSNLLKKVNIDEKNSLKIYAKYEKFIYPNVSVFRGLNHRGIISCRGFNPITNREEIFNSKYIYFNPLEIIEENLITTFPVIIDRENPKRYIVVLKELYELNKEKSNKKTH